MPVDVFAVLAKSNLEWLVPNTIYITRHGSWAYGTNIETSDEDFKGVVIPPAKYFHGFLNKFEQATFSAPDPDITIMDLRKFVALAADGNPSVIEVLWTDPSDHVVVTAIGKILLESRDLFLSRKVKHTFSGYAIGQLRRIQGHYRWLKNPPKDPPSRSEHGLPERTVIPTDQLQAAHSQITKQLDKWSFKELENVDEPTRIAVVNSMAETLAELKIGLDERYVSAGRLLGFSDNFLELLDQERRYKIKQDDWKSYLNWQKNRNPQRSVLEEKWGYDCKHAMHLVRLLRMAKEILTTGKVLVRRPDREELLAIREGAWTYEALIEWAYAQDQELTALMHTSLLPKAPDRVALDALCQSVVEQALAR